MKEKETTESINKFDMKAFKEYVNTYDEHTHGGDNNETIVEDMIYGVGLCLDREEYCWAADRDWETY